MVASDGPVTKKLPSSVAAYNFFMRKVFFDGSFHHPLLVSVSSPLVSDVSIRCGLCDGPCFSLSSSSFSSANILKYIVHQTRKLLNQIEARITNYLSRETAVVLSPPRKRNDRRTPFDDQWHDWRWQQDWWQTILKGTNLVKSWCQHGTKLVNSSIEHKYYKQQMPSPKAPSSDIDFGQPQRHHPGTNQSTVPSSW